MRSVFYALLASCVFAPYTLANERQNAAEIIDAINTGALSAQEAVEAAFEALDDWAMLNGLAHKNTEAALGAARAIDAGEISGPLAGLPIVVKDNIRVQGLPNGAATPGLQNAIADTNAPVLQALVDAGAIVIATSNMHELAFGISGWNPTYQTGPEPGVRNPYDVSRFAGGSSSGTGALVGAGVVAAGLGTDTGGSVRIPAAVNGVAGLRPSLARYDRGGVVPISSTRDTPGVIAASVADIELIDRVITGDQPVSAASIEGVRLGVGAGFTADLDADTAEIWQAVLTKLKENGVEIIEIDDSKIFDLSNKAGLPIALMEAKPDLVSYLEEYVPGTSIEEIVDQIASPDVKATYEQLVLPGLLPTPDGLVDGTAIYEQAVTEGVHQLRRTYEAIFSDHQLDALIFPTTPQVAAPATAQSSSLEVFQTFIRNTDPGSVAGLPGLSLAAGLGSNTGLPVGIELDGLIGSDRRLIALGMAFEDLLGRTAVPTNP